MAVPNRLAASVFAIRLPVMSYLCLSGQLGIILSVNMYNRLSVKDLYVHEDFVQLIYKGVLICFLDNKRQKGQSKTDCTVTESSKDVASKS